MRTVKIGNKVLGQNNYCYIIAEAGANHNRDKDMAFRLIDVAAQAGADAVKFQTYSAETLYSKKTPRFKYLKDVADQDTWDLIKAAELPRQWQPELAEYARSRGIDFLSTPFDYDAVDELHELDVPAFKIASFEIVDLPLIRYAASKGRPMILSTGMANYGEIEEAIAACREVGNENIVLLQCVSLYPSPVHLVNLRAMETMRQAFGLPTGLSDHTQGIAIPTAAAALGASVLEKHYTLDRSLPGPDHPFALEPHELHAMVSSMREVAQALGNGRKEGPSPEEEEMYRLARRSLIAAVNIPAGTPITEDMIVIKRPGYGIKPRDLSKVIGSRAARDIAADEVLEWEMLR